MIIRRLVTTLVFTVLHAVASGLADDDGLSREQINVSAGKRVRMECELSNLTISGNMKVSSIMNDIRSFLSSPVRRCLMIIDI